MFSSKTFKILWIFYRKLLIPAIMFSVLISFILGISWSNFGLCFLLFLPLLHYFIYEVRLKNEYVFYANFGLSKKALWIITVSTSVLVQILSNKL